MTLSLLTCQWLTWMRTRRENASSWPSTSCHASWGTRLVFTLPNGTKLLMTWLSLPSLRHWWITPRGPTTLSCSICLPCLVNITLTSIQSPDWSFTVLYLGTLSKTWHRWSSAWTYAESCYTTSHTTNWLSIIHLTTRWETPSTRIVLISNWSKTSLNSSGTSCMATRRFGRHNRSKSSFCMVRFKSCQWDCSITAMYSCPRVSTLKKTDCMLASLQLLTISRLIMSARKLTSLKWWRRRCTTTCTLASILILSVVLDRGARKSLKATAMANTTSPLATQTLLWSLCSLGASSKLFVAWPLTTSLACNLLNSVGKLFLLT